jgi:hypothetical protein
MQSLEELIMQRLAEATKRGMGSWQAPGGAGGQSPIPQPQTVSDAMGGGAAPPTTMADMAAQEISPEDYNYFVEIQRRDVFGDEGEKQGWDKNVRRWAEIRKKAEPSLEDLHSSPSEGGMKRDDQERARDSFGRFVSRKRKLQTDEPAGGIFDYEEPM